MVFLLKKVQKNYFGKEIKILNCYNLEVVEDFYIYLPSFVENIENNINKKKNKKEREKDILVWSEYFHKNHELILLYENKIVRGNIKDKDEQKELKELEYY